MFILKNFCTVRFAHFFFEQSVLYSLNCGFKKFWPVLGARIKVQKGCVLWRGGWGVVALDMLGL